MTAVEVLGSVDELADGTAGSVDAATGAAIGPYRKSRLNGPIPGIAGRSPSYFIRQLYDFKYGARAGIGSALMKPTVEKLTIEEMISLAAYAASLAPRVVRF